MKHTSTKAILKNGEPINDAAVQRFVAVVAISAVILGAIRAIIATALAFLRGENDDVTAGRASILARLSFGLFTDLLISLARFSDLLAPCF